MKTAMQELIDWIECDNDNNVYDILDMAKELLEKEKEQIKLAWLDGKYFGDKSKEEEYYNQTYNQKNNDKCGCFVSDGTTSMNCKFCSKHYSQHI